VAEAGNGSSTKRGTKPKARKEPPPAPEPEPETLSRAPVCTVAFCPICMAVTAAQGAAPDALEHLLAAAREFFLAARAVIDARGDHLASAGEEQEPSRRFERIEIS
jgi:hypothetical protein